MSHYTEQREADEKQEVSYEYGVDYPTNGQRPDLPNDVLVECRFSNGIWHEDGPDCVDEFHWGSFSHFRITDERYKPKPHQNEQREADDIWTKFPDGATHYADGTYLQRTSGFDKQFLRYNEQTGLWNAKLSGNIECYPDYQERPKPHQNAQELTNKYSREIIDLDGKTCQVDVYRVLEAFEVDSHAIAHSIKKLLAPGKRHAKTREQDLKEAIKSIEAELLLMEQRK